MIPKRDLTAGIDEVGMGPIAGPAVFTLVIVEAGVELPAVRDSKKLSDKQKHEAAVQILERCGYHFTYTAVPETIDKFGIGRVWQDAMKVILTLAIAQYPTAKIVIDGSRKVRGGPAGVEYIVGADRTVLAVSAASVLAKCQQILEMDRLHDLYPEYGFNVHHGYGVPFHVKAIKELGAIERVHRRKYVETIAKNQGFKVRWRPCN